MLNFIMIILTAGHTGPNTGAIGTIVEQHGRIDEGTETIRLRNRIAEILAEKWGIIVLLDRNNERLGLLTERINRLASPTDICLDLHLNSHSNPTANGTEVIISSDATNFEIVLAVRLLNATAKALQTNIRGIKSEKETPHKRLAMLHLNCQNIILEVCFCTNPNDGKLYITHFEALAQAIARTLAENILVKE
jgi:N-acetylmuramoyl-L-alanine amidase